VVTTLIALFNVKAGSGFAQ